MANAAFQCITNRWQHREMPLVTTNYFAILLQMKKKKKRRFAFVAYRVYTIFQHMWGPFE